MTRLSMRSRIYLAAAVLLTGSASAVEYAAGGNMLPSYAVSFTTVNAVVSSPGGFHIQGFQKPSESCRPDTICRMPAIKFTDAFFREGANVPSSQKSVLTENCKRYAEDMQGSDSYQLEISGKAFRQVDQAQDIYTFVGDVSCTRRSVNQVKGVPSVPAITR